MSDFNHYQQLGVDENASFDEIQQAKEQMLKQHSGDRKQLEAIEAAYDAILMDRLRLRQEGKIKVPDRIRFPEQTVESPPKLASPPPQQSSNWLQGFVDTPSRADILYPAGLFGVASLLSLSIPAQALGLGVAFSLYFLNRKEHKFLRAFLMTLAGLALGVLLGYWLGSLLVSQLNVIPVEDPVASFAAIITFVVLWVISGFLR